VLRLCRYDGNTSVDDRSKPLKVLADSPSLDGTSPWTEETDRLVYTESFIMAQNALLGTSNKADTAWDPYCFVHLVRCRVSTFAGVIHVISAPDGRLTYLHQRSESRRSSYAV
jgi:hypothetical protein